ncbi:superoxide dismutase family protein [Cellulomonas wangsupingiae]|uniref:superoxide dismutase family protein n=1 Tax=Cellulomonas wangsupingiae TaxID=2968085 RepID=UPI001D0EC337|nr:superoxide dismutase family protein [Cellulomonas wangsupingiae]MCM0639505.1 superoxide dismutase family protein [Cellulomonas wangsupingiae]
MRRTLTTTFLAVTAAVALTACTASGQQDEEFISAEENTTSARTPAGADDGDDEIEVTLVDADNNQVGTAWVEDDDGAVQIEVAAGDLPPGFHGFHLHTIGECAADSADPTDPAKVGDFLSAGGHVGADTSDHGAHPGDLPSLLVDSSGSVDVTVRTDGVTVEELLDDDGTALMIHADRDNFAHVPERYAPSGPDEQTLKTGDAGDRIVCGVLAQ